MLAPALEKLKAPSETWRDAVERIAANLVGSDGAHGAVVMFDSKVAGGSEDVAAAAYAILTARTAAGYAHN